MKYTNFSEPEPVLDKLDIEILIYVSQKMSNKEICSETRMREQSIKNRLNRINGILGVSNRGSAVEKAREYGLLD
jgi:ATP/maltotriose-dependent transcriptional regulator MalT